MVHGISNQLNNFDMKKSLFIVGMTVAVFCMQSCSDDDLEKGRPLEPGAEIIFGAKLDSKTETRTHYGPETNDDNAVQWNIYWNYSDNIDNLDQIFIYSPQGCTGRNQAKYTVHPTEANQSTAATITKIGDFGVQAGSSEGTYDFYGLYPASAVKGQAVNDVIHGYIPNQQSVSFAGTIADASATMPEKPEDGEDNSHKYLTKPDMNYCLMTASNTGVTLSADKPVQLQFKPFSSVLDITINGPKLLNTPPTCLVTSVMVIADAPIAGDFSYDFKAGVFTPGDTQKDTIEISTLSLDQEGNLVGIPMANGNTLRLQAFLLPNPDVTDIQVKVFTSDAQVFTKKLKVKDGADNVIFKPSQIHKVVLPLLDLDEAEFDYSHWLAQLDPRIYLSEVSLPGSTSSFSWKEGAANPMQTLETRAQFEAGIRVFRGHIWLYDMESDIDHQSPAFGINVNGTTYVRPMAEVIRILYKEMQAHHPDEFCVLMIADYKQDNKNDTLISNGDSPWNKDNGVTFYQRFKVIMERMVELGYVPDHIDANTTIGDVKGKVIVKLQLNGDGISRTDLATPGNATGYENVNNLLAKVKGWNNVDGGKALMNWWTARNGEQLFYAPMTFGQVGSFEYTDFSGVAWGKGIITLGKEGLACTAAKLINDNATYSLGWNTHCSVTTQPEDNELNNVSNMWYIYGAQANPSNDDQWTDAQNLVGQARNAIIATYNADSHNKFYMTYLGGAGNQVTNTDATTTLVKLWNDNLTDFNTNGYKPYGWVLFNNIPDANKPYDGLSDTEKLVRNGIKTVISRNNDVNYKLKRKLDVTPVKARPSGDTKGTANGGSAF